MGPNKQIVFETTSATYTAEGIVGEGGSGFVYKAVDDSGHTWAVKWLDPAKTTREKAKRFKNELQFCLRNKHPNIVSVLDYGIYKEEQKASPFYVMPLYNGSLRGLLQLGIPTNKALIYFAHMLDGVEAAHFQRVIHRDLKPENILYDANHDLLLVADFGIAHFEEDELYTAVETKDSTRLANFQYAAPEQRGRGLQVDHHADIYALGLMLNEIFTGEVPYGTGYKTIGKVAPDYEYLDDLVSEMLHRTPTERISSVESIKQVLISRKNEFIARQTVSKLKDAVIPVTEIDDPLIADPPRLVGFTWDKGILTLSFQRPVNDTWVWALRHMGGRTAVTGKGPEFFDISGNTAIIDAQEKQIQRIIDYFKSWLPEANRVYEQRIRQDKKKAEEKHRQELQRQIEEQEARQRVLKNVKI